MSRTLKNANPWSRAGAGTAVCLRELKGECGDAIIEFTLVMVVFFTLIMGIASFGHALYAYHFVSHAAKTAARWAAVNGSTCGPTVIAGTPNDASCNGTGVMNNGPAQASDIANYVAAMTPPGITSDPSRLTTTATWPLQPNGPTICNTTQNAPGCTVQVQVSYKFNFILPLIGTQITSVNLGTTSEMVVVH